MGQPLDWMPNGAKVATVHVRKTEGKCLLIVLYETNGLERRYFSIDESAEVVVHILKWNCNSELLAALVSCGQYDVIKYGHERGHTVRINNHTNHISFK